MKQLILGITVNTLLFGYIAFFNEKTGIILPKTKFYVVLDFVIMACYFLSFLIIMLSPGNLIINIIICLSLQFLINHIVWGSFAGIVIGNIAKRNINKENKNL